MQKKLTSLAVLFTLLASAGSAQAAFATTDYDNFIYGIPNSFFGNTGVGFSNQPTGTAIGASDYAALGVASITETEGLGFFGRYSRGGVFTGINYAGTGSGGERGTDTNSSGWDGTILIEFSLPVQVATLFTVSGVPNPDLLVQVNDPEIMRIYDSEFNLLESGTPISGTTFGDAIAGFERPTADIKYLEIKGDYFGIFALSFTPVPEPSTYVLFGLGLLTLLGVRRRLRKSA